MVYPSLLITICARPALQSEVQAGRGSQDALPREADGGQTALLVCVRPQQEAGESRERRSCPPHQLMSVQSLLGCLGPNEIILLSFPSYFHSVSC